ncbi:MAG: YbaK/EbsC family protein [Candidatus Bipolaricaulia bacterium]
MGQAYHAVVDKITSMLAKHDVDYEFFEHEPVRTSEEAAAARPGYSLRQGAKAMVLRLREPGVGKRFALFVLPADRKLDMSKLKQNLGIKDVRFAQEGEVEDLTGGVVPGGVPPFAHLFGVELYADPALFETERIAFNCGDRRASVAMAAGDYRRLAEPTIVEIS